MTTHPDLLPLPCPFCGGAAIPVFTIPGGEIKREFVSDALCRVCHPSLRGEAVNKRISDKERLDWVIGSGGKFNATLERDWWVAYDNRGVQHGRRYPRAAIDAAIRSEHAKTK